MKTSELTLMVGEMISLVGQLNDRIEKIKEENSYNGCSDNLFDMIRDGAVSSIKEFLLYFQQDLRNEIVANPAQFSGEIIDIYENFCDEKTISIENPAIEEYNHEAGYAPGENDVKIFGVDYDSIADAAVQLVDEGSPACVTATLVTNVFADILASRGSRTITTEERTTLEKKVIELFDEWCLLSEKEVA